MPNLKATDRNTLIGKLADLLQSGKSTANKYQILPQVPLIGGTGLGDLFMGNAPELVDDMSYDGFRAAIRGGNAATGGIGTYGARPAVADAALLGMDIAGLGKGLSGLSKKSASALYDKLIEGGTSVSKRDALKKLGAIAGGAALTGTGVGALRKLSDNVVSEAAHIAPKVADNVAIQAPKKHMYETLAEYLSAMRDKAEANMDLNYGFGWQMESPDHVFEIGEELKNVLKLRDKMYSEAKDIKSGYLREDIPGSTDLAILDEFSPQAKQEMKAFKDVTKRTNNSIYGRDDPRLADDWIRALSTVKDPIEYVNGMNQGFELGYF